LEEVLGAFLDGFSGGRDGVAWRSGGVGVHEEVVAGYVGTIAGMAEEGGELCIVADAVEHGVEEQGAAGGAATASGEGGELELLGPVDCGGGEERTEEVEAAVVGGEELVGAGAGDAVVVRDRETGETLGVAKLGGGDVLEEVGDGVGVVDVTGEREGGGVGGEEGVPAAGGSVVPGNEFFGGEGGKGGHSSFTVEQNSALVGEVDGWLFLSKQTVGSSTPRETPFMG
jgi:hypothetical protein